MENLKMHTPDLAGENFKKLAALFPNAVTETITGYKANGDPIIERAIDADVLRQEISATVVEGPQERYQFTWPDKKKSVVLANQPIAKTLRLDREKSVGKDGTPGNIDTENIYIEGDNLDALKLLQETYLGKVKMIYIDPPYNTGNDFIYEDDFSQNADEYLGNSGQFDEEGNRLVQNTESNGRFHTDWLNMLYPRLRLAKDLLTDDGAIFISIDDNEQVNLSKICDEIFGAENRVGPIIQNKQNAKNDTVNIQKNHEFLLVYRKAALTEGSKVQPTLSRKVVTYRDVIEDNGRFYYLNDPITTRGEGGTLAARPNLGYTIYYNSTTGDFFGKCDYDIELAKSKNDENEIYNTDKELVNKGYIAIRPPHVRGRLGCWTWALDKFNSEKDSIVITGKPGAYTARKRTFVDEKNVQKKDGKLVYASITNANSRSILDFSTNEGTNELNSLIKGNIFNNPKNLKMLQYLISLIQDSNAYILDFFSGSATTAHAVMQLNAEDGGHRKFIMVQLPEQTDVKSEAHKSGYKTICDIGEERIRRAGKKIKEESPLTTTDLDVGFRVFKVDSTNMEDVYYRPADYNQGQMELFADNIKPDRSPEDLLFQVMLDLGIPLSSDIQETEIAGKKVFSVADGYLIACFDKDVTEETVKAIAQKQPVYAVFRDSSMASDSVATNFEQIFETYSPRTQRKVL